MNGFENDDRAPHRHRRNGSADAGDRLETILRDTDADTYTRSIDPEAESVAMAVVSTVAAIADADPEEIDPLYRRVDPDALELLFRPGATGLVAFTYHEHEVVVRSDGELEVTPLGSGDPR